MIALSAAALTLADHRGDHPGGDHSGCLLSLRPGLGHPHRHHGRDWECHQTQLSRARGRRFGRLASVSRSRLTKNRDAHLWKPEVVAVHSLSDHFAREDLFLYAASVESHSEHPLGKAIVSSYGRKGKQELSPVDQFKCSRGGA